MGLPADRNFADIRWDLSIRPPSPETIRKISVAFNSQTLAKIRECVNSKTKGGKPLELRSCANPPGCTQRYALRVTPEPFYRAYLQRPKQELY